MITPMTLPCHVLQGLSVQEIVRCLSNWHGMRPNIFCCGPSDRRQIHSRSSRPTSVVVLKRNTFFFGTINNKQASRKYFQNDIGATVRSRCEHCQELTFCLTCLCARFRKHCHGLLPHVAVYLLLLEPYSFHCACISPQPEKKTNESERLVPRFVRTSTLVKVSSISILTDPAKMKRQMHKMMSSLSHGVSGERACNRAGKTIVHRVLVCAPHFRAMDVSSQALIDGCKVRAATSNMTVRMTDRSTAFSVCASHDGKAHPWRCTCLQRRLSSSVHVGYPAETSQTSSVTGRPTSFDT